jgi:hypothetical protein
MEKIVTLPKIKTVEAGCPTCGGHGHHGESGNPKDNPFCPDCNGRGKIVIAALEAAKCLACNGKGMEGFSTCFPCAGTGRIQGGAAVPAASPSAVPADSAELSAAKETVTLLQEQVATLTGQLADAKSTIKDLRAKLRAAAKDLAPADPPAEPPAAPEGAPPVGG